eukprot:m.21639 g.21639  ORF g.21639 m.21639 type:complete len:325 (+) comp8745_c0_seq1:152-1126(+)
MSLKFGTSSEEGGNNMSWNPFADMTAADNDSNNNNSNNSNNNNNSGNESAAMEKKNKAVLSLFGDSSDVDVDVDAVDVDDATEHNRDCDATPTPFSSSKPLNTANEFAPRTSPSSPFVIRSNIVLTEEDNINVVVSPHNSPLKSALSSKSSPRKAQKLSVSFPAKLFVKIDKDGVEEENYVLYQTLYKFESDHPDDLSFEANEILQVIDEGDGPNSWFTGRSQDGRKGVFPGTYVRKIVLRSAPSVSVDVEGGTVKVLCVFLVVVSDCVCDTGAFCSFIVCMWTFYRLLKRSCNPMNTNATKHCMILREKQTKTCPSRQMTLLE